ncbi:RHS repeat protein [Flavobacterium sp. LPB0248]|uniref:RHS repeat domain-containing protein n=1 Tax=Flavobacterium sp. LPB0248 TaxID=2614441 RepID=UPI0015A71B9B|nr:RHS repeat domain-containing protein [Flavobacterium sp. LPB0248]QLC65979.1 RHS repeat protein [Flavobacterium sp. LPB0248]
MKNTITLLLLLFLMQSCSTISKTTREQNNLKGNVKSVTFKVFEAIDQDGVLVKGKEHAGLFMGNSVTTYNKKGFKSEYIVYSLNNELVEYHKKYKYNWRGLVKEEEEFHSNGELKNTRVFNYKVEKDSLRIIEKSTSEKDKNYANKYDRNKNLVYYGGNTLMYDKDGRLLKEKDAYTTNSYEYDANGNMTRRLYVGMYSSIDMIFKYTKLDDKGNWIEQIESRDGKAKFITERKLEYY